MTFEQWLHSAIAGHAISSTEDRKHYYFRFATMDQDHWLFNELDYFKHDNHFFSTVNKGIHCRFGMKGVIAECHYDGGENFATSLGGLRRWVMAHPNQCENLYLLKKPDVSARHSEVDWSNPDYGKYPKFKTALANEIILQGGQLLYVPSFWFHFIVSLNVNFQCNCRSSVDMKYADRINKCMGIE